MILRAVRAFVVFSLLTPLYVGACGDADRDGLDRPVEAGSITAPSGEPTVPPSPCTFQCSPDLKSVTERCLGEEPKTTACGPDQGCGLTECVDACESARLSRGSVGCSFWTLPADDPTHGPGACFAAKIAHTGDRPVSIQAELGSEPLDVTQSVYTVLREGTDASYRRLTGPLPVGEVAIVFLSRTLVSTDPDSSECPAGTTPALLADPIRHGTGITRAFHLITDAPVAAYSIFPYGGATSFFPTATLLLPSSSWDTGYYAVAPGSFGNADEVSMQPRTLQVVAEEDATEVSIRPNADIVPGSNVAAAAAGEPVTYTLGRGQVLQITQPGGLGGSPISANKPVGLFGGASLMNIPSDQCCGDVLQQQIAPFAQWGSSYALVPYQPRVAGLGGPVRETVVWSFVGSVDGTELTYEPQRPGGAPVVLASGQVVTFATDAIVSVRSQDAGHPFHAGVHMTGSSYGGGVPGGGRTTGDPEFVGLVPSDQFLDRYVFFTDFTYPDTSLTIVRRRGESGFLPVRLGCAGEITGFEPVDSNGELERAWVRLTTAGVPQTFPGGTCGYGRQEATSEGQFSVTVWGTGRDASYGYAAGRGSRPINTAPPPQVR